VIDFIESIAVIKIKFCIIGLGRMGRRHLQVAKNLSFDIVGVFDPLAESISLAKEELGISENVVFGSVESMLIATKPQAVVIASTAPSHCEHVESAAKAGVRYILCEKPMAISIDECNQMIAVCTEHDAILAINHQMQFMEQYTRVKHLINTPEMGELRSITVSGSNFGLAMNAVHYFEMFRYLTGEEINTINFWADVEKVPNPRGIQYEDLSGQMRALSRSGIRLNMEIGGDLGHGIQVVYGCRYGQILVDELGGFMRFTNRNQEFRDLPSTRYGMPSTTQIRNIEPADAIASTQSVWQAILKGESYPDGVVGLHAVRALVAANISAETSGETVYVAQDKITQRRFLWA
jgi:predicted dehydrogenase